ncbi:MAG: V-type ATP synthase subunit F [Candidatus Micrarchaeia archaeon]
MKIVAVGSKEMCNGLRLAGVKECYHREDVKDMSTLIEGLLKRDDVGVIILDDGSYSMLSWALKKKIETIAKPSVVTVPDFGSKTVESESLEALVKRALGFDLKKG